jgi:hypothetical protein
MAGCNINGVGAFGSISTFLFTQYNKGSRRCSTFRKITASTKFQEKKSRTVTPTEKKKNSLKYDRQQRCGLGYDRPV